jgi:hypothetical protein
MIPPTEPPAFQKYPMMMRHPGFQAATLGTSPDDRKGTPGQLGTPLKFPPVTVNNTAQEEYHAAQGYIAAGNGGNPAAFVQAHVAPSFDARHQEYPKWVGDTVVNNEAEELVAMERNEQMAAEAQAAAIRAEQEAARLAALPAEDDRLAALEAAVAKIAATIAPPPPASVDGVRAMFEARAEAVGLKPDGRWSLEKLIGVVGEAEGARG